MAVQVFINRNSCKTYGNTSKKKFKIYAFIHKAFLWKSFQTKAGPLVLYLGVGSLWEPKVKPHKESVFVHTEVRFSKTGLHQNS